MEDLKAKAREMRRLCMEMSYIAGAEGAQATGNAGDDVVDGEFTEK